MTRIRFKGSPRSWAGLLKCRLAHLAVSQLLLGAPLGTALMYASGSWCQRVSHRPVIPGQLEEPNLLRTGDSQDSGFGPVDRPGMAINRVEPAPARCGRLAPASCAARCRTSVAGCRSAPAKPG